MYSENGLSAADMAAVAGLDGREQLCVNSHPWLFRQSILAKP